MSWSDNRHLLTPGQAAVIAFGLLLGTGAVRAQDRWHAMYNVRIENVAIAPRGAQTATVTFDISWQNSLRDKTNHDAAWVFFKVRADNKAAWQPVRLVADKVLNPTGSRRNAGVRLTAGSAL